MEIGWNPKHYPCKYGGHTREAAHPENSIRVLQAYDHLGCPYALEKAHEGNHFIEYVFPLELVGLNEKELEPMAGNNASFKALPRPDENNIIFFIPAYKCLCNCNPRKNMTPCSTC